MDGWKASRSRRTDLALETLEMAIWARRGERLDGLTHRSDRGVEPRHPLHRTLPVGAVASMGASAILSI